MKKPEHPSSILKKILEEKSVSQRELASIIQIAPSVLSGILLHNKSFTAEIAVKLEAAGYDRAKDWLVRQAFYDLFKVQKDFESETKNIIEWNNIQKIISVSYFRKQGFITSDLSENISNIYKIYNVSDLNSFFEFHNNYTFSHYRKSSAFTEQKNNVISWSVLAEYLLKDPIDIKFDSSFKDELITKLNQLFKNNKKSLLSDTKNLLANYGIKFNVLDRPSKTPVDGKSFMSNNIPAIVLSLKYKRLDNFAFTIMHELGHVFLHLTQKHGNECFYINSSKDNILEFEANLFARNALIPPDEWKKFERSHSIYTDEAIIEFSKKINVHPAIIRGRVCFEYNNYYRRKSSITSDNIISFI